MGRGRRRRRTGAASGEARLEQHRERRHEGGTDAPSRAGAKVADDERADGQHQQGGAEIGT